MKISTEIASAARLVGEERAIALCAEAGFDAWDFSLFRMVNYDWWHDLTHPTTHPLAQGNYRVFARRLRRLGEDCGISCNQSHAPYPSYCPAIRDSLKRAIECTAIAGGDVCVIHPMNRASMRENCEMFSELLPFAKEYGVRIAAENMWEWNSERNEACAAACSHHEEFRAYLDALDDESFVACLDVGHAEMRGLGTSAVEMIHALGDKLAALHIHDNDRHHDSHQLPFSMEIDFAAVMRALREVGYVGDLTLEADRYLSAYKKRVPEGLRNMAAAARRLAEMFEMKTV